MIDLHIHTNHSDGMLSVEEILKRAREQKIGVISFCDHNVLGAYEELEMINKKEKEGIRVIPGIEFDFVFEKKRLHILGYEFNWKKMNSSSLINRKTKDEIIEEERKNLKFLKKVCKAQGIKIDDDLDITETNQKASTVIKYNMMKFEENNEILDEMLGKDREKSFARGYVQNPNSPFFIDETIGLPTANDVANVIHTNGGKVFLAHPYDYKNINGEELISKIYNLGILDGIECIHTRHSKEQVLYIKKFCKEHDLLVSGGSDFHRDMKQKLGFGIQGTEPITEEFLLKKVEVEI